MRPAALLLLALAVISAAPPPALTYRTAYSTHAAGALPRMLGSTDWSCREDSVPRTYIADELAEPEWRLLQELVRKHERDHREWRQSHGGCLSSEAQLQTVGAHVDTEVSAFCAGARVGVSNGWYADGREALFDSAYNLSGAYGFGLSIQGAWALLARKCGDLLIPA